MKKALLIFGALLVAGFTFFTSWTGGSSKQVGKEWAIELPKDGTEVYNFKGEKGAAYLALIYDDEETAQNAFEWVEDGATKEYEHYLDAVDAWMEEANVPSTLPIDMPEDKYYYISKADGSELIIVPDYRMLHFIQKVAE